ncbi:flagellar hook-length control protein FliK [Helicobacter typhlonius]|uniref:flagellar hook-length control protein FliK n=1 Tax=Helicobacter typhlonius TaxID=76936 RepID=UPI002FE3B3E0
MSKNGETTHIVESHSKSSETTRIVESQSKVEISSLKDMPIKGADSKETKDVLESANAKRTSGKTKKSKKHKNAKKQEVQNVVIDSKESAKKPLDIKKIADSKEIQATQKVQVSQILQEQSKEHKEYIAPQAFELEDDEVAQEIESKESEIILKPQAKGQMLQNTNAQNKGNVLAQSLAIVESNKDKNHKDSQKDSRQKMTKSGDSQSVQSKNKEEAQIGFEDMLASQFIDEEEPQKIESFNSGEKKKEQPKEIQEQKESQTQKSGAQKQSAEVSQVKQNEKTQILYRSALAKENIRYFAQTLREEILNYKPPVTKLSMELNPRNLGSLELTITKKGKDLHISVLSNANAVGLFLQNQVDFRNSLAQVGFENVDISFSSGEKGGGDNPREQNASQNGSSHENRNKNGLEDSQNGEINMIHITLPKYA